MGTGEALGDATAVPDGDTDGEADGEADAEAAGEADGDAAAGTDGETGGETTDEAGADGTGDATAAERAGDGDATTTPGSEPVVVRSSGALRQDTVTGLVTSVPAGAFEATFAVTIPILVWPLPSVPSPQASWLAGRLRHCWDTVTNLSQGLSTAVNTACLAGTGPAFVTEYGQL